MRTQREIWEHSLFGQNIKLTLHAPSPAVSSLALIHTKSLHECEFY